ncbi:MAG: hypothetical protein KIS92_19480 [Planctomycetota bacterium]|nr:hypothetical protein [Planctomycetota bacterium]
MDKRLGGVVAVFALLICLSGAKHAAAEEKDDPKTTALGGLSASFLLQTHINIGLLADLSVKKDVKKEDLAATLKMVEGLLSETEKQLDAVLHSDIADEDKTTLKQIKSCYALLDEQISALHAYWKEPSEEGAKTFEATRGAAWKKISETLGIK